jgi:hypothetical protein
VLFGFLQNLNFEKMIKVWLKPEAEIPAGNVLKC